jgi:TetR/AcrR family transcriptional regulator, cholesterol catabolism regulator
MAKSATTGTIREPKSNGANRDSEILEAAVAIFAQKGYAAASLQDVADAVGLMKGSLYHYIDSKESLLFRIFEEAHIQANQIMESIEELNLGPGEKLREFTRRLSIFYVGNRERASIYFTEWRHLTGEDSETVKQRQRDFRAYVRGLISEAQEAGLTRKHLDVRIAANFLLAAVNGIQTYLTPMDPLSAEALATEISTLACASILTTS